ncbi:MAG: class I SAM-dependent methyltransferase [Saprospiraceae bacterium]
MLQNETTTTLLNTQFIDDLLAKNGPDPEDYETLKNWYRKAYQLLQTNQISKEEYLELKNLFGEVYASPKSLLGHVSNQPHGYAGDFEIIEMVYVNQISPNFLFQKWDSFYQGFAACHAVRNRKTYFKNLLKEKVKSGKPLQILNLASGPCRDLLEFFEENPSTFLQIDCIELDRNAIDYATQLLGESKDKVHFIEQNIFKFQTDKKYDLVWSAGLFDYFDHKVFTRLLTRFLSNVKKGGELVIGNFHPRNPTFEIMEFTNWHLHHRTETNLVNLANQAGITDYSKISIEMEPEGVNLFLRIRK